MSRAMDTKDETRVDSRKAPGKSIVTERYADETLHFIEQHGKDFGPLTPEKEKVIRRKSYLHVMGLLSAINLLLFVSCPEVYKPAYRC